MQSKKSMVSRNFDLILKSQSVYLEVFFIFKRAEIFTMKSRADFQTQILFLISVIVMVVLSLASRKTKIMLDVR